jgi:hypothetical protein
MIRILKRPFRMPVSRFVVASFIVFGGSAMGFRRKLVLLGGFSMRVVHVGCGSQVCVQSVHETDQSLADRRNHDEG